MKVELTAEEIINIRLALLDRSIACREQGLKLSSKRCEKIYDKFVGIEEKKGEVV